MSDESRPALTDRQQTLLVLVAQGKTYKEIGTTVGRSWKTVRNSIEQLRAKFKVGSRGELVAQAVRLGIVPVGDHGEKAKRSA
jgi:DNA-binding CsgD family transcriptional regulator